MGKFKKGQSGNPGGAKKMDPKVKEILNLNREDYIKLVNSNLNLTMSEMQAKLKDPKTVGLELIILSILMNGIKEGDYKRLDSLLNRSIGRVPLPIEGEIEHSGRLEHAHAVVHIEIPSNGFDRVGMNAKKGLIDAKKIDETGK